MKVDLKLKSADIPTLLKQHKDIIIFVLTIVIIHFAWKLGRTTNADESEIAFYGISFSHFFDVINVTWAKLTYIFIHLFEGDNVITEHNRLIFNDNNSQVSIVWGCSGLKELIMTLFMLLAAKGRIIQKLWYIPMSIGIMILINYLRLIILTYVAHYSYELFDILHSFLGRLMMYGGIVALWYIWIERLQKQQ